MRSLPAPHLPHFRPLIAGMQGPSFAAAIDELNLADALADLEHSETVAADLLARVAEFEAADDSQAGAQQGRSGATRSLTQLIRRATTVVKNLDAAVNNRFRTDATILGEWKTASHVERAPRPKAGGAASLAAKTAPHVRIARVAQGDFADDPDEKTVDHTAVNGDKFLFLYVEAELPKGAAPQGEYGLPGGTKTRLDSPTRKNGQFRFVLTHYLLTAGKTYLFHFADDLASPTYQDSWEVTAK